jgi:diguanylate cyclase (GGDEF)-like protein
LSELRIDRLVQTETHRQLREFFLYAQPRPDTAVALAIAEPPSPDQPDGLNAADPVASLERCLVLQTRAISFFEAERLARHNAGLPAPLANTDTELLALLEEAIWHERKIVQDYRTLQTEVAALRTERDELVQTLRHTETLSLTDELTGLPNRRAFVQRLEQELSRSQRTGQPLAMVLLDIDNFKDINDRYGHYVGDMILRCYAQSMVPEIRQHDLLARYGGEEFVLLLPETLLDDARYALEKLGRRIRREPLDAGGTNIDLPSFSAGIACLRAGESATTLINRADQSLYRAKRMGRNRIETDEQLPP